MNFSGSLATTRPPPAARRKGYADVPRTVGKYVPDKMDMLRGKQAPSTYRNQEAYDNLINLVLNSKKDITRINGLDDYENGVAYAKKHGLRIEPETTDWNNDGVHDVILVDKKGNPIIINGYKISPSKQPLRKMYQKARREGTLTDPNAGYRGFVNQLYGVELTY